MIDVDKDGKKELILCITTTSMAGMREVVYDYDEKADVLREEYNGNPYPEKIDREKSGIVYFVMEGDNYDFSVTEPICKSDYEKWRKDQGLESTKTEILFQALTAENIGKI